jgi:hypothetical protein
MVSDKQYTRPVKAAHFLFIVMAVFFWNVQDDFIRIKVQTTSLSGDLDSIIQEFNPVLL